jgi:hypothetical protein
MIFSFYFTENLGCQEAYIFTSWIGVYSYELCALFKEPVQFLSQSLKGQAAKIKKVAGSVLRRNVSRNLKQAEIAQIGDRRLNTKKVHKEINPRLNHHFFSLAADPVSIFQFTICKQREK